MGSSNNHLEILINLIYLARHNTNDLPALQHYLAEAEREVMALAAFPSGLEFAADVAIAIDASKKSKEVRSTSRRPHAPLHGEPLSDL